MRHGVDLLTYDRYNHPLLVLYLISLYTKIIIQSKFLRIIRLIACIERHYIRNTK